MSERVMGKTDRIAVDSAVGQWFATQLNVHVPSGATDAAA
jgi:hypothetical protein